MLRWPRVKILQRNTQGVAFRYELFLLHSPLLEESFVVSFPPLTYMLKFRGYFQLSRVVGILKLINTTPHTYSGDS